VTVHTQGLHTLAQVGAFVSGNEPISFTLTDRHATYGWMADTLRQLGTCAVNVLTRAYCGSTCSR
jgi:hypothetical protein